MRSKRDEETNNVKKIEQKTSVRVQKRIEPSLLVKEELAPNNEAIFGFSVFKVLTFEWTESEIVTGF